MAKKRKQKKATQKPLKKKTSKKTSKRVPSVDLEQKKEEFLSEFDASNQQLLQENQEYYAALRAFIDAKPLEYFNTLAGIPHRQRFRIRAKSGSRLRVRIQNFFGSDYEFFSLKIQRALSMSNDGTVHFPGAERTILTRTDDLPTEWFTIYDGEHPNRDPFTMIFFYLVGATGPNIRNFGVNFVSPGIFLGGQEKSGVHQVIWEVDRLPRRGLFIEIEGEFTVFPPPLIIESEA